MVTIIAQRDLRNDSAEVMRRLEAGEAFTLTRNGTIVGHLQPAAQPIGLVISRPASRRDFAALRPISAKLSTGSILTDMREDRV